MIDVTVEEPRDMVSFFVGQNKQIKSLIIEALAHCGAEREKAFFELRHLLAAHEAAEARVIHPRIERLLADGQRVVQTRQTEEQRAKSVVAALETLDVNSDEFVHRLNELRAAVDAHIEREEREELAKLQQVPMAAAGS